MKVAVLYSGGKDSNYALYLVMKQGLNIKYLLSIKSKRPDSYMFHIPCIDLTRQLADCIGIPLIQSHVSGIKEQEVDELKKIISKLEIDGIVSGSIASQYQKSRIEKICNELNLKSITPLWQRDPEKLLKEMIDLEFEIMIVGVAAHGLDKNWLGRVLDEKNFEELKKLGKSHGIHLSGEGGEYETIVLDGPIFKKKIEIENYDILWHYSSGYIVVKEYKLTDKKNL